MAPVTLTTEHTYLFFGSMAVHITYFYLVKIFVPSIGRDRKRLSWVLTLVTAMVVSVLGPYSTFSNIRTVFSDPVPYESYGLLQGNNSLVSSAHFYRYDIPIQFALNQEAIPLQDSTLITLDPSLLSHETREQQQSLLDHDEVEDNIERLSRSSSFSMGTDASADSIIEFYKAYDASYSSLSFSWSSPFKKLLHSRWLFDLRFSPSDSWMSQASVIFFACYLICDLACGALHYREKISLVAGWFHHTMYTGICYYTVISGESHTFASFMIIEIPTLIIGLGFVYKRLRNDMIFGVSFILLRIIYDFALTHEMVMHRHTMTTFAKAVLLFKSAMNFKFMIDWLNQQIRLSCKKRVSAGANTAAHIPASATVSSESTRVSVKNRPADITDYTVAAQRTVISSSGSKSSTVSLVYQQQETISLEYPRPTGLHAAAASPSPRSGVKNRKSRTRTGGSMEDQARVDLIAVR
ncbi:hypothetical protein BGZ99_008055 [Dissophora globulifera]|uniref:TLC domain-containing protein n=1 Tax=Dissophora globulifera TaxID=979702 RepID=A0A9P6RBX6_9FUNG|nr:hypothetical protein BGZ99_008055 [Dissophora globulifera]